MRGSTASPSGYHAVASLPYAELVDGAHVVQVYEHDGFLVDALARFVADGIAGGAAVVVIATAAHRSQLHLRLEGAAAELEAARGEGRYVELDAETTLARFMLDDGPDEERFTAVIAPVLEEARRSGSSVRAFGEMVAVLWAAGRRDAAIRLEALWNRLADRVRFGLLCAYPLGVLGTSPDAAPFAAMCDLHSDVLPAESYAAAEPRERLRLVAQLQQRAEVAASEEAARRIAEGALRRQRDELEDVFANAAVPICRVAADGRTLHANRAHLELLGYEAPQYIGRALGEFHVEPSTAEELLARIRRGDTVRAYETAVRCGDGSTKYVSLDVDLVQRDGAGLEARCYTRDVTAARERKVLEGRLAALVECSDDAIVGKSLDGIVTSWNRGAERIFGYTAAEMIGQPIARLMPPERRDDLGTILGAIRRGERVDHFESERIRKDGERIHVSLTVSPIVDGTGRIVGASKIARDVTARKRADAERDRLLQLAEQARLEAEAATRAKDDFLSVVSHELRTPLASILGWVNVLKMGASTPERTARAVETIERSGKIQAKLIEDLLDVSRIISGRMRLDLRLVDLAAVMRDALETIRPTADAKGVRLAAEIGPGAGPVAGDADRLHQIAWNLLSNAVKFTPAGGLVELRLVRHDEDVHLVVRDTGAGIAASFLQLVFDRFRQAESVATRRSGGLGLGLAIVRHLTELHGGTVAVDSAGDGRGATFTVRLPLMPLRGQSAEDDRLPQLLRAVDVLLVEDDTDARDGLAAILEAHGARVRAVGSAEDARRALAERTPDVLVSDISLPGDDGYALIRELRAAAAFSTIPAVAVTGRSEHGVDGILAAGYQVRLDKPVDPDLLVTGIAQLTARAGNQPVSGHTVLVVEDDADVRGALTAVLQGHGYDVVEAEHGRAALEAVRRDPTRFCLILLDLFMPEMDGWAFRREQANDPRLASIPVMILTADSMSARRAAASGVVTALTKPVDFEDLMVTVRQHC